MHQWPHKTMHIRITVAQGLCTLELLLLANKSATPRFVKVASWGRCHPSTQTDILVWWKALQCIWHVASFETFQPFGTKKKIRSYRGTHLEIYWNLGVFVMNKYQLTFKVGLNVAMVRVVFTVVFAIRSAWVIFPLSRAFMAERFPQKTDLLLDDPPWCSIQNRVKKTWVLRVHGWRPNKGWRMSTCGKLWVQVLWIWTSDFFEFSHHQETHATRLQNHSNLLCRTRRLGAGCSSR